MITDPVIQRIPGCDRLYEPERRVRMVFDYTDIITFDYTTPQCINGDVFISWETVQSNAAEVGVSAERELLRILAHGLLHLTGQGDKTPETKAEMTRKENQALGLF